VDGGVLMDRLMTKLAYSRLLTTRWQAKHLAVNYSLLALACAVYLIFGTSAWIITLGALPGALIFLVSLQALAYRKFIENESMFDMLNDYVSSLR
jgi:hypothetical protein